MYEAYARIIGLRCKVQRASVVTLTKQRDKAKSTNFHVGEEKNSLQTYAQVKVSLKLSLILQVTHHSVPRLSLTYIP